MTINALQATNRPPQLALITPQVVDEETLLTITAQATDPDGDQVLFSLGADAPSGAGVHPTNGTFTWTPTEAQGPATDLLHMIVSDDGSPPLAECLDALKLIQASRGQRTEKSSDRVQLLRLLK